MIVPIIPQRVRNIVIRKDREILSDPKLLGKIKTKQGDFFNRKTFYEQDRPKLFSRKYDDVIFTERPVSPDEVDLEIHIVTKKR